MYPNLNQQQYPYGNNYNNNNYNNNYSNQNPSTMAMQNTQSLSNTLKMNPNHHGGQLQNNNQLDYQQDNRKQLDYDNQSSSLQSSARSGFIRKVYTLVTLQLLVTIGIGYIAYNSIGFQNIFVNTPMIVILSVVLMVLSIVMGCCNQIFRKFALLFFILFTLVFALLIGVSICGYKSKVILMAAGITFVLSVALTLFACFSKTDMTSCGPYLMIFCLVLLVFGIVAIFWRDPIVQLIYSSLSALLFGFYMIFDIQLVLGTGKYQYTLDDAYMAAIQIYIDIVQLFLHILRIVGQIDR